MYEAGKEGRNGPIQLGGTLRACLSLMTAQGGTDPQGRQDHGVAAFTGLVNQETDVAERVCKGW